MRKNILLFTTIIISTLSLSARHIIGGVMNYECLGGGDYEFTMKMYRDCNCTDCADFDVRAPIGIYRCGGTNPCSNFDQRDVLEEFRVAVEDRNPDPVPNADYPCLLTPPDVCVQEAIYKFKLSDYGVSLPISNESYYIVYQRCCRNETIDNLRFPSQQGLTVAVEITPFGQRECNSSPVFNEFPPTIICAGQSIDFDHSATDPEGDLIVYEFCAPLNGGGNSGGACLTPTPTPPCPPPYSGVNFQIPDYTFAAPMGGDPVVTIDPSTGFISGVPTIQGQFVVGVCATEYRNGIAMGRIVRDFQFNVGNCDPLIEGIVEADEIIDGGNGYLIESCGELEVSFRNVSSQQFVNDYFWEFEYGGTTNRFDAWSPTVSFPAVGSYEGVLYLNPGSDCGDTTGIIVNVYPPTTADFDFDYDTCVAGPVQFVNNSFTPGIDIIDSKWDFGNGETSDKSEPNFRYIAPGLQKVNLLVEDANGCFATVTKDLPYFPIPRYIVISPSAEKGCTPYEVLFNNLSTPIDETYAINWDFGDGGIGDDISPIHIFEESGIFTVKVEITSPIGCVTDTTFFELINIEDSPTANFVYSPEEITTFNRTVDFLNQSLNSEYFTWNFNNEYQTIEENPTYTFRDTGVHFVRLVAVHESGCRDTVEYNLNVLPQSSFYLPNAFTPNNDSKNDLYVGVGETEYIQDFEMLIWNRWGEIIFQTNDPTEGWNGLKNNVGKPVPLGAYIVFVKYIDGRGELQEIKGTATVVR